MKYGLAPAAPLRDAAPLGVASARSTIACQAVANKVHIDMGLIRWPVAMEIAKKHVPVRQYLVLLKVP